MLNKIQFLKFEKYADGLFKTYIYDDQLEDITKEFYDCFKNVISKKTPLDLFNLIYEEVLKEEVKKQNIPENQISNAVANIRGNPNFNNHYRKILDEIRTLNTFEEFYEICKRIENIVKSIPNTSVSISIPGRNIQLNPYNIFTEILTKFNSIVTIAFINLKPKFVYLDEEMELKGAVIKNTSWSNTLKEENKNYSINARLFRVMNIDIEDFEKKPLYIQRIILRNSCIEFSKMLKKYWDKNIMIGIQISEREMSFEIEERDNKNEPIKITLPEYRSKGFKWYLAYLITLEYLRILKNGGNNDIVLLLDDPAVYLHPNVQKSFLEKLEELSKEYQILYNTHLMSLFNEEELDRVLLVYLDKENRTKIKRPWSNEQKDIIYPIRRALGVDKILFKENLSKILFVEGISDKFILEGLGKLETLKNLKNWYIHPLSGGDKLEDNEIVKKVRLYSCLSNFEEIKYYFLLDGDKKEKFERDKISNKIIFLGDENQEIEDLIDKNFYLDCVLETYKRIFTHDLEKFKKVKEIVEKLRKSKSKIIEELNNEFRLNNLGDFSKVDVAITIKRKLYENPELANKFEKIIDCLNGKII